MENDNDHPAEPENNNDFQHRPTTEHESEPEHHHVPEHHMMSQPEHQPDYAQQPSTQTGQAAEIPHHNSAGTLVLQWMTYALWGWTVFAMSFLTGAVFASAIEDTASDTFVAYVVAAILVLLPIALVCDYFYSKREPVKKTGGAAVVLVIHAVIFALFAIGSLITVVFSIISMAIESGTNKTWQTALYTAIIVGILYAAVLMRTINPPRFAKYKRYFSIFMIVVVTVLTILAFTGPVKKANLTKTDRLIQNNITQLAENINTYTEKHGSLPSSLSDVDTKDDVKKLVTDNLVVYKPNTKPPSKTNGITDSIDPNYSLPKNVYYYQLCVTYKKPSDYNSPGGSADARDYQTNIYAYSHEAGNVCYKVASTYDFGSSIQ